MMFIIEVMMVTIVRFVNSKIIDQRVTVTLVDTVIRWVSYVVMIYWCFTMIYWCFTVSYCCFMLVDWCFMVVDWCFIICWWIIYW